MPVVQGYAMTNSNAAPMAAEGTNYGMGSDGDTFNGQKGEHQPKKFNDVFFAVLFYLHLGAMAILLPISMNANGGGGDGAGSLGQIIYFVTVCGIFAVGVTTISLGFMMQYAKQLVKLALFFQIGVSLAMAIFGLMAGSMMMAGLCFVSFAFSICYTMAVWGRIPFAAANLNTALTAVRANLGLSVVAYTFLIIAAIFSMAWTTISNNILATYPGMAFLLFLSYFWTHQVLKNTIHVTTAGVIGTWWFAPHEASSCCSRAIGDSFGRATTYSFGSICFGSLIVAVVQALRHLNHHLRGNEDAQIVVCIIDCFLACIEGIIEYFNKWAYVYVGLYGYSYLDAGRNVMTLFQNKGWTVIIADDLAENVLFMMSTLVGLLTGAVGFIVASLDGNIFADLGFDSPGGIGFVFGLLVGFVLSSILMSVVASAVNTVIVCYAESPREFEVNHSQLSAEMREAWSLAYPSYGNGY